MYCVERIAIISLTKDSNPEIVGLEVWLEGGREGEGGGERERGRERERFCSCLLQSGEDKFEFNLYFDDVGAF